MTIARLMAFAAVIAAATGSVHAAAPSLWSQSFESDTSGWTSGIQGTSDFGTITRLTGPLAPFDGAAYARVTQGTTGSLKYAPFTQWGGYNTTFPIATGYSTRLAVYLSPSTWTNGNGFDFSSAVSTPSGGFRRDFYFHVAVQANGDLLVGADFTTTYAPRLNLAAGPNYKVTTDGWYQLEHIFSRNGAGVLVADLRLLDAAGNQLFSQVLSNGTDTIPANVGGNRYGWFSFVQQPTYIDGALIPAPGALALLGLGGLTAARRRRD